MKASRILSFPLLIASFILLCNPNLNLFDILPDAIGYGLFMLAIRRSCEIFPHFDAAYRGFRTLFWVNLAKIPAIFVMLYITGIDLEERALITVFALGFAIIEWIFAFPAFRALFEGFAYLGESRGVMQALRTPIGKSVDHLSILTIIFLIIKGATSFLPETVYLSTFDHNGSLAIGAVNPAVFYPFFAAGGMLISLVMGLIWLFSVLPYFKALERDGEMQALLLGSAELLKDELLASDEKRHRRFFLLFLSVGFIFAVDPLIGNRDLLPNAVAALAFFLAFVYAKGAFARQGKIFSLLYLALSVTENIFSTRFFQNFEVTDVPFRDAALVQYVPVVALRLAESVLLVLTVCFLVKTLKEFILAQTGKTLRPEDLVLRNEVHTEFFKRVKRLTVFSVIYALLRPFVAAFMAVTTRHVITEAEANEFYSEGEIVYYPAFSQLWIVLLVVGAALAVYAIALVYDIKSEAEFEMPERIEE